MPDNLLSYVKNFIYGFRYRRLKVDNALHIPETVEDAGNIRINQKLEVKINGVWQTAGAGTIDPAPTAGSANAVGSGGTKTYVDNAAATLAAQDTILQTNITAEATARQQADANLLLTIRDNVPAPGDTLNKLFDLIVSSFSEVNVPNSAAKDAYNVIAGNHVFVIDDGDGKWALYKALTSGVNATYVKLTDANLFNSVMSAAAIKAAYESNPDTNAFTNALRDKLNALFQPDISGIVTNATAIQNEINTRAQAVSNLISMLTTEQNQRISSDNSLNERINNLSLNGTGVTWEQLQTEILDRQNADAALQNQINSANTNIASNTTYMQAVNNDLLTEKQNRIAGDQNLQVALQAETSNRQASIDTVVQRLQTEEAARADADTTLYNMIANAVSEVQVNNLPERDAYNIKKGGTNVFVLDDGDGKWALYKAMTAGVNATYVKLSDPDLLGATMNASQIKAAYESNPDTNAFTNALKAKLDTLYQPDISGIAANAQSIANETTARQNADAALQTSINANASNISANTTAINNEVTARTNADAALQTSINTNASNISANTTAINNEVTNRTNADANLQNQIGTITGLSTTDKTNLVAAINETFSKVLQNYIVQNQKINSMAMNITQSII